MLAMSKRLETLRTGALLLQGVTQKTCMINRIPVYKVLPKNGDRTGMNVIDSLKY